MPRTDLERKRAYERLWRRNKRRTDSAWHEREKRYKRLRQAVDSPFKQHPSEARANLNERRWRFSMWEIARIPAEWKEQHIAENIQRLESPIFVFSYKGKRQTDSLSEPMPTW